MGSTTVSTDFASSYHSINLNFIARPSCKIDEQFIAGTISYWSEFQLTLTLKKNIATIARALFGVAGVAGVARQNVKIRPSLFPWTNFIGLYTDGIQVT